MSVVMADGARMYPTLEQFVGDYVVETYRRVVGGTSGRRWAADWWRYPEAVARLEALWEAFEHLHRQGGLGMSVWWRDHADHHMSVLLAPDGPFAEATDTNSWLEPLPLELVPAPLQSDVSDEEDA